MERLLKEATPLLAETGVVPDSVPPPGLVPIAMAIELVAVVTVLLLASCTVTCTAALIEVAATVLDGCTVIASLVAVPAVILNVELMAAVSPAVVAERV